MTTRNAQLFHAFFLSFLLLFPLLQAMSQTQNIQANGLSFSCRTAGDKGEPVILLHGFPETNHMWLPVMEKLSQEGYQCLAPNQRGYCEGARPKGKKNYKMNFLVADIMALADAKGWEKFHLIGHDWGSAVGWAILKEYPERIQSWTALSVPHVDAFAQAIQEDAQQQKMSKYMKQFKTPWVPEWLMRRKNFKLMKKVWKKGSKEQIEAYTKSFKEKYALTGALNWYRANYGLLKDKNSDYKIGEIHHPTLMIWGEKDIAIGKTSVDLGDAYMKGPYQRMDLPVGHWLVQEAPDEVISAITKHLKENPFN